MFNRGGLHGNEPMSEALKLPRRRAARPAGVAAFGPHYAALDLGTNNCRLLIAAPAADGFRVVEAYSRIVRLGEGLSQTGELQAPAMDRALAALRICAQKVERRRCLQVSAVATQACRSAANGAAFVDRVRQETGLRLQIITPHEEAQLSVASCADLLDPSAEAALVLDVGGGSTELSWVDLTAERVDDKPTIAAWLSIPIGVVTLAERFPEDRRDPEVWYRTMVEAFKAELAPFRGADALRPVFERGAAHLIGASGAITSLAGLHLGLPRYERARVDGLWLTEPQCRAVANRLMKLDVQARALEPCIGVDRADLILGGAAILQAVQELWPCPRARVADRGLREGLLLSLMADRSRGRRNGRAQGGAPGAST